MVGGRDFVGDGALSPVKDVVLADEEKGESHTWWGLGSTYSVSLRLTLAPASGESDKQTMRPDLDLQSRFNDLFVPKAVST
jgi:hypothetical protein